MRAGFPHSEILGSKLACQLPEAYRRLQRPSSPVVAKASTTCTCSLDPITLSTEETRRAAPRRRCNSRTLGRAWRYRSRLSRNTNTANAISYPDEPGLRKPDSLHFFRIVKEQPNENVLRNGKVVSISEEVSESQEPGGANRDRTGDLLLAKQALSQLSYGPGDSGKSQLVVGLGGLEPPTPRLSSVCSNQLSYRP